jgi:hypothetical protein
MADDSDHGPDDGDDIGYRKPPRRSQFRKGQSGNPNGRPKGTKNLGSYLLKALNQKITVTEGGRRYRITKLEAALKQLVNKAATADLAAMKLLVSLFHITEGRGQESEPAIAHSEADENVIQTLYSRLLEHRPSENEKPGEV